MKKIKLSVKEHNLTDIYVPTFIKYDYVETFDFENDEDIELLYEKVNLFVHTYYTYTKNTRNEKRFDSATAIFLDFDTKDDHKDSTIDEFLSSGFAEKYSWLLYTSKSHISGEKDCFHVILPLDDIIRDVLTLRSTYNAVFEEIKSYGLGCDFKVRDGARLIFPSMNISHCEDKHFDNFVFECHRGGEYIKITNPTIEEIEENISHANDPDVEEGVSESTNESIFLDGFNSMSIASQYKYIECVMRYMNTTNRSSKYKTLSYNQWVSLGMSLNKLFGPKMGLNLFQILSKGHPKDSDKSVMNQFGYLDSGSYTRDDAFMVIFRQSSRLKFRHMMYFRYFYESKQVYSPTKTVFYYNKMVDLMLDDRGYDLVSHKNVRIFKYSPTKKDRVFLMEISSDGYSYQEKITMGEMKKFMGQILEIPVEFVTVSVTRGIIRKFINKNGIYDITGLIRESVFKKLSGIDLDSEGYIPKFEVKSIISEVRKLSPSTISDLTNIAKFEKTLIDSGIITKKEKHRFYSNGSVTRPMSYKIDKSKIDLLIQ